MPLSGWPRHVLTLLTLKQTKGEIIPGKHNPLLWCNPSQTARAGSRYQTCLVDRLVLATPSTGCVVKALQRFSPEKPAGEWQAKR